MVYAPAKANMEKTGYTLRPAKNASPKYSLPLNSLTVLANSLDWWTKTLFSWTLGGFQYSDC